jgi:ribose 1,5-bisphosphokinase PhnN
MYRKLGDLARDLAERDRESDEEIARRFRLSKKEVSTALKDLKRLW